MGCQLQQISHQQLQQEQPKEQGLLQQGTCFWAFSLSSFSSSSLMR